MTDLDKLEEVAKAATPGPWGYTHRVLGLPSTTIFAGVDSGHVCYPMIGNALEANATFIAAANPAVVLNLIAELRDALARIARVEALHQPDLVMPNYCAECSDFGGDTHPVGELIEHPCATVRALTGGEGDGS